MTPLPSRARLLWLQLSQGVATQLALSVFYPFLSQHFSFAQLSLQSLVQSSVPLLILPFIREFWIRRFILLAFAISIVRMLLATRIDSPLELYSSALLTGSMLVFFWVPYEILYFREQSRHGTSSAWYFSTGAISSVITPLIAGLVADTFGYTALFSLAALMMIIPLGLAWQLPDQPIHESLWSSLPAVKGIKHLLFLDGFLLSASMCLLGLSLLTFTKTATQFGAVSSVVTLAATLLSFVAAKASDQDQHRWTWIAGTGLTSAVTLIMLGWQTSFWWFSLLLILYTSLRTLAQPIVNALPMDLQPDHTKLYIARQFVLNVGRVIGFALTWGCVYLSGLRPMYVIYALGFILYITCVRRVLRPKISSVMLHT